MSAAGKPWMMFYPADWRADPSLRVCSVGARGLWMEMLCLMHEAEPRGSLLVAGKQVSEVQLASLVGTSRKLLKSLITELEQADVFSRDEDRTIYSRRMRRDIEKAERDRENGKGGGNPILKGGVNPPDKAQKPEARDQKDIRPKRVRTRHEYPQDFLDFWAAYPTDANMGKREALDEWLKLDDEERRQAIGSCPSFVRYCKAHESYRPLHANRYLKTRRFDGHASSPNAEKRISLGGGVCWTEENLRAAIKRHREDQKTWPRPILGPPPGEAGCKVPPELLSSENLEANDLENDGKKALALGAGLVH